MPPIPYTPEEKRLLATIAGSIISGVVARDRYFVSKDPFAYRNGAIASIPTALAISEMILAQALAL